MAEIERTDEQNGSASCPSAKKSSKNQSSIQTSPRGAGSVVLPLEKEGCGVGLAARYSTCRLATCGRLCIGGKNETNTKARANKGKVVLILSQLEAKSVMKQRGRD
jgi:hypothetical protein